MTTATDGTAPAPVANTSERAGLPRFAALDVLRALAAFAVLLTHAADATVSSYGTTPATAGIPGRVAHFLGISFPTGIAFQQLNLGVEIFFVISAFLVYRPFLVANVDGRTHPEPIRFLWKRAWRIYPAYWVALFVIVATSSLHTLPNGETALTHILLVQSYDPLRWFHGGYGLRHSWTLVVEISFYCFIPFWAWTMRFLARRFRAIRVETLGALALVVTGPAFVFFTRGHSVWTPFRVLPPYLGAFGFGMLLAVVNVHHEQSTEPHRLYLLAQRAAGWCWLAAAAVFAVTIKFVDLSTLTMFNPQSTHQTIERIMHSVVAVLVVVPAVVGTRGRGVAHRVLRTRWLARIGLWSYGFYLWHYAFIDLLHEHRFDPRNWWFLTKIVVFSTVGATLAGAASWYLIEQPFVRLGAGRVRRPQWLRWQRPSFYTGLWGITLAALAWRVTYVVSSIGRLTLGGDAFYYHTQANDIAHGRWFIDPSQFAWYGRVTPSAGHPPAYLLYLAGVSRWIGQSELTHRLASTLLGAATVFAVGFLARKLFDDDRVGWFAAAFAAVYAHLWINDEMLMSETMAQLWTVIAFIAVYRCWRTPRVGTAAWMGAAIGLAALSRAEAATLFPLLVIPLFAFMRTLTWKRRISLATLACVMGGLTMAPWLLYNVGRFEHPVLMSNGIGSVLMVANCDRTYGNGPTEPGQDADMYLGYWSVGCAIDGGFTALQKGDESEKEVEWRKVGVDYIKAHKGEYPEMMVYRIARMWDIGFIGQNIHPFNADLEGRGGWPSTLATLQYLVLMPLGIHGLVILRRRKVPILPFLAVAGTITFTAATTFGITRYRAPVDALLPVLAAGAVVFRLDRSRRPADPETVAERASWPRFRARTLLGSPVAAFCVLALTIGTLFAAFTPALAGYDEGVHLFRAWQLSNGHVRSVERVNAEGQREVGDTFPKALRSDALALVSTRFYGRDREGNPDASGTWHRIRAPAPTGDEAFYEIASAAVYAPVPYLPAVLAIRVSRTIGLSTFAMVFAARMATLIAYILLVVRALQHLPRRRWLFATLALAPVCAFQAAMLSADGITIALTFVVIALAQRLASLEPGAIRWPLLVEAAGVVAALALSKPPFILFAALLLPALWKHRKSRAGRGLALSMVPGAAAFLVWTRYAQSIYVPPRFGVAQAGVYAYNGVDTDAQLQFLRDHPFTLFAVIGRTIAHMGTPLLHDVIAQVTSWSAPTAIAAAIAVVAYGAVLVAIVHQGVDRARPDERSLSTFERVVMVTVALVTAVAVFALAYTGWNRVGAPRIDAFQGRYLFPSLALLLLALPYRRATPAASGADGATGRLKGILHASTLPVIIVTTAAALSFIGLVVHFY